MARNNITPQIIIPQSNERGPLAVVALVLAAVLIGVIALGIWQLRPNVEPAPVATPSALDAANAGLVWAQTRHTDALTQIAVEDAATLRKTAEAELAAAVAWRQLMEPIRYFATSFAIGIGLGALLLGTALVFGRILFGKGWRSLLFPVSAMRFAPQPVAAERLPAALPTTVYFQADGFNETPVSTGVQHRGNRRSSSRPRA